ncbi:hypothetical protein ACROYT_G033745 [Oculina patagonica]
MLRHHQADVHVHQGPPNRAGVPLNIARYRKIVTIALWLQMTLVACYVPFGTVAIVEYFAELSTPSVELTGALTFSLLLLNSTLNPFLYCWKMREADAIKWYAHNTGRLNNSQRTTRTSTFNLGNASETMPDRARR